MRSPTRRGSTLIAVAAIPAFLSCSDAPTGPLSATGTSEVAFDQVKADKDKSEGLKLHYARVRSDGTLVDGTAVAATRLGTGSYRVTFPPGIGTCAATANSTAFQGFDTSVFRTTIQIGIGFGAGGAFDDQSVGVNVFNTSDGSAVDTSFSLTLVCP